ncbi:MAG: DUF116 domain-containing protein, partial [bacterium]|nr:DUF116 domain-containing protein [bacterium]
MKTFRLLDSGALPAAENVAMDQALLLAKSKDLAPPTLRFLQYSPAAVLIGRHQTVQQEVRTQFCEANNYHINRRITGGGAILFDTSQLGWELIASYEDLDLPGGMAARFKAICKGCIKGLQALGLEANFRPMNDIEINGRKISGTGGIDEGNAFLFQGTLLIDFDAHKMIKSLRIPIEKLEDKEIESIKDRVTWVKKELGYLPPLAEIKDALCKGFQEALGITLEPGGLNPEEKALFREHKDYYASPAWIHKVRKPVSDKGALTSTYKSKGGIIRTSLNIDARSKIIQQAFITGDFFVRPQEAVYDLEAVFKNVRCDRDIIFKKIDAFFGDSSRHFLGITADDIKTAVAEALKKSRLLDYGYTLAEADNISTVAGHFADIIKKDKIHLLMPYCAKKTGCNSRYEKDCIAGCDACTVGLAVDYGGDYDLRAETIINFEDLMRTLTRLKNEGYDAFIGCCCQAFHTKHREDFEKQGLPGILIDIESETCYDLGLEKDAYSGKFANQTDIKLDILKKTLGLRRPRGGSPWNPDGT